MDKIATTRFGEVLINDDHLINFKDGIIGFPTLKQYVLIESPSMPLVLWLQSTTAPGIAFPVAEPWFFRREYKAIMTEADKHALTFEETDTLKVFVVLTIPDDMSRMTVNLKAPVVIDIVKATATQLVMQDKTLEVRVPAYEAFNRAISHFSISQTAGNFDDVEDAWSAVDVRRAESGGQVSLDPK